MPRAAAAPAPAPPEPIQPPTAQDLTEDAQHRRVLALLVDLGAALATEIANTAPDEQNTPAIRAEAFERVSRATRRTILVARHVAQQIAQRSAALAQAPSLAQRRTAARTRLIREVEDNIQAKARPADAEALRVELIDRLDAPELEADLVNRPTADLIADFLRDLGLAHPPGGRPAHPIGRRTPADIARLNLLAALPPGQAAALAPTLPKPKPPPPRPAAIRPPPKKPSWRDKPPPDAGTDPETGIRPDSLLASILKTTER